jgi:nucleoside phosphorylase
MSPEEEGVLRPDVEASIREQARDVLKELPRWTASPGRWSEIHGELDALVHAMAVGDVDSFRDAVAKLAAFGSSRVVPLGTAPVGPAPKQIRLVYNQLVHDLGLADADPASAAAFDRPAAEESPLTMPGVSRPELVLHFFAPTDGAQSDHAYDQLGQIWAHCRDKLGTTANLPALGLPAELPPDFDDLPRLPAVAAMTSADDTVQVILRWEHDILVLSVLCAAGSGPGATSWSGLDEVWASNGTPTTDALLGIVRLYLGLGPDQAALPHFACELAAANEYLADEVAEVDDCVVLTFAEADDVAIERKLIVLAGAGHDRSLSAWTWSRGDASSPTLVRYLVNAAKVRYEASVRQRAGETVIALPQDDSVRLSSIATRLSDMRVTVEVARQNQNRLLGAGTIRGGFLRTDAELADWLHEQLVADLAYLTHERERRRLRAAGTGPSRAVVPLAPTFGLVTALPEEFTAMRLLMFDQVAATVADDRADYVVGTMSSSDPGTAHRVVLTLLGDTANSAAAEAVAQLIRSHPSVDQIIMVGIAAGVPTPQDPARHVRLGDVICATWGIVAYDHVVDRPGGPRLRQDFPRPSALIAHRAKMLEADELLDRRPWEALLTQLIAKAPPFARPPAGTDVLHDGDGAVTLSHPDPGDSGHRADQPKIHYGALGSADRSVRNGTTRDLLVARYDIRGIEMEGSGVGTAAFSCGREWFVVRGVSDYADSHLNKLWRRYAAATAAAYVAALLAQCPPIAAHGGQTAGSAR